MVAIGTNFFYTVTLPVTLTSGQEYLLDVAFDELATGIDPTRDLDRVRCGIDEGGGSPALLYARGWCPGESARGLETIKPCRLRQRVDETLRLCGADE